MAPWDSAKDYYTFQELSKATDFILMQSAKELKIEFDPSDKQNVHEAYAFLWGLLYFNNPCLRSEDFMKYLDEYIAYCQLSLNRKNLQLPEIRDPELAVCFSEVAKFTLSHSDEFYNLSFVSLRIRLNIFRVASSDHIFICYSNLSSGAKLNLCELLLLIERVGNNSAYPDISAKLI